MRSVRALSPAVAGRWYPRGSGELAGLVDRLLDGAAEQAPEPTGPIAALIAPHAGFAYSGAVAASAFTGLRGRAFDRVVLVGPSHHFGFAGAAVPERDTAAYRTPLGAVPIDRDAVSVLAASAGFRGDDRMFEPEHALEAELPFLQRALDATTPIVPILIGGGASSDDAARVATAVGPLLRGSALLVISSDFTHFGPRFDYVPFTDDVQRRIRELDLGAIRTIEAGSAASFSSYVEATGTTICGHRAVEVLLRLPIAVEGAALLAYDTSGRMTGNWDHSVSYAALAVPSARPEPR
jgi:AmmeMemoRadiSam system protein B